MPVNPRHWSRAARPNRRADRPGRKRAGGAAHYIVHGNGRWVRLIAWPAH
jgi:hypothetical protein